MAASSASDRFSLGVTLYVLATGKHPFDPSSVARWMEQVTQHTPTPPATDRLGFDERFSDLIMKLLTKNPSQRFGSTMEMLIDLEESASSAASTLTGANGSETLCSISSSNSNSDYGTELRLEATALRLSPNHAIDAKELTA